MRHLFTYYAAAALACTAISQPVTAQIQNGNFEARNQDPRGPDNVKGPKFAAYDDLPGWTGISQKFGSPNYLATPAAFYAPNMDPRLTNDFGGAFPPHNDSKGCVALSKEQFIPESFQFITQQVTLLKGHRYQAKFYALRRPGYTCSDKLALYVTEGGKPDYVYDRPNSSYSFSAYKFSPEPYAKVVSPVISDTQNWTEVTGTFIADGVASGSSVTASVTLGYADTQVPQSPGLCSGTGPTYYIIDDVSLTDLGPCPMPTTPSGFQLVYVPNSANSSLVYDIAIPNGEHTTTYMLTLTDPAPPYSPITAPYTQYMYTGSGWSYTPGNEQQPGYTRFHLGLVGPQPNTGPGNTFRVVVTATGPCGSVTGVQNVTLPAVGGGGGAEDTRAAQGDSEPYSIAYPNPTNREIQLPNGTTQIQLVNSRGRIVVEQKAKDLRLMSVDQLPAGLYHLRMVVHGKSTSQRIQIQH
ncbi:T9SS type A sorting domain-containing protein [Hymenobacter cellulosivorans]|uniref:T9SS type A sorting domain-containing protein n=1 Tax=Hymenobacter cellulosivorans TaxID=2932249 RepID=A0ABY4F8T3_9BACT|nr:T9SS type A sorting domain-containing protein [Hymenobacter cellulosivorans]UOQ53061.1 T9SS type A sorting domain-containing protein [Hymenobacter cellulosivorans]